MIVVDVETTGLNWDQHSLLSIGAIDFSDPARQFSGECHAFSGAKVEKEALEVNGFSQAQVLDKNKPSEAELVKNFLDWVYDSPEYTVAGQNVYIDVEFVRAAARRAGESASLAHRIIDQHSICYAHMIRGGITPPSKNKKTDLDSDKIMEYVGIPPEPHPHIALNGAKWEAEAFSRLLYGKALFEEFSGYPVPW